MLMDILVVKLAKGEVATYSEEQKEMCVLLTEGGVEIKCGDVVGVGARKTIVVEYADNNARMQGKYY